MSLQYPITRSPSKQIPFRNECSICGKPLRKNSKNKVGFICRNCGPHSRSDEHRSVCISCDHIDECSLRVRAGIWIRCETPDVADIERLKLLGGAYETIRTVVDSALGGEGDRQILETAVSEGAKALYQSYIEGRPGEESVRFRVYSQL